MRKAKKTKEYFPGKVKPIVQLVARMIQKDPSLADNMGYVWANLCAIVPELKDNTNCANCGGSMAIYRYNITYLDAELLLGMAKIIHDRMKDGIPFTEANKIHLQSSEIKVYSILSRTTIASKLGLVAKVMKKNTDGKIIHDHGSGWSITTRGFDFLKGKKVIKSVPVFHNRIVDGEREEYITMTEVYGKRQPGANWADLAGVFVEGYQQGKLL